jgi:hypothetical protein
MRSGPEILFRQRADVQGLECPTLGVSDDLRCVDLGLSAGFEADLRVDERGPALRYQHLFERGPPPEKRSRH